MKLKSLKVIFMLIFFITLILFYMYKFSVEIVVEKKDIFYPKENILEVQYYTKKGSLKQKILYDIFNDRILVEIHYKYKSNLLKKEIHYKNKKKEMIISLKHDKKKKIKEKKILYFPFGELSDKYIEAFRY